MQQATFSIRMEEGLKQEFDALCTEFGMSMSTAINVFARAVVRQRRIPFDIAAPETEITRENALKVFQALRAQAKANGLSDMSLEEINQEIHLARNTMGKKQ